jgi:hypothetical protein
VGARARKLREAREGARDYDGESLCGPKGLHAALVHARVAQAELDRRLAQERGLFLAGFHEYDAPVAARDGERDARQPGPRADVRKRAVDGHGQMRQHGERVEQVMAHHRERIAQRGQVVGLVPLRHQRDIGEQPLARIRFHRQTELSRAALERLTRGHAVLIDGVSLPCALRFRCTARSEIAAGVTPEIRPAWPSVCGRCAASFWRTSTERPRTAA